VVHRDRAGRGGEEGQDTGSGRGMEWLRKDPWRGRGEG